MKKYLLLPLAILLTSCGVYRTQMVDIPLMGEKGELQLSGSVSSLLTDPAVSVSATYALTDHLAIQGYALTSAFTRNGTMPLSYLQGAVGYFTPVGTGHAIFELYAGVNLGWRAYDLTTSSDNLVWYDNYEPAELNTQAWATSQCYFLQANYGWCVSKNFEWGFALKAGALHLDYSDNHDEAVLNNVGDVVSVNRQTIIHQLSTRRLIEPQMFFRWGRHNLKYHFQMGFSCLDPLPYRYDVDPFSMGFGVSYRF